MGYLTETTTKLSLPALTYDADERVIKVGERNFVVNADLAQISPWVLVNHEDPNQLEEAFVCMNLLAKPIGTPKFHKWLGRAVAASNFHQEVAVPTIDVIRSVFVALEPEIEVPESEDFGSFGFNVGVTDNQHANLITFGSCACLHPNPEGRWVGYEGWNEGYCEYDFHNIDFDAQAWSLLAGLGHLATLAAHKD